MTSPSPNIEGFHDAQKRLRGHLGMDVRFFTPLPRTYPPGTVFNPETGRPFDPTIKPLASGFAEQTIRCSVLNKRLQVEDDTETTAAGIFSDRSVGLAMDISEWPPASAATEFEVFERRFEIRDSQVDGLAGQNMRRLVYGEVK